MKNLKILREAQQQKLNQLEVEISNREQTLITLDSKIDKSNEQLSSLESNLGKLSENFSHIENKSPELKLLQDRVQELKNEVNLARGVYDEQKTTDRNIIKKLEEELKGLKIDLRNSTKELKSSQSVTQILDSERKDLNTKNSSLLKFNSELIQTVEEHKRQKDSLDSLVSELKQANEELAESYEEKNLENIRLNKELEDKEIPKEEDIEIEEILPEDTAYPWSEHIEKFIDPETMPEVISFEELEEFAKKETLSKNQLRQLQSLHGDLDAAKGRLEAYFKKPPVTRSEIDEEIKAIQDAMAELLRTAKVKRIIVDPFVYSLRKIRTHFKTISENKAIESLKKKKLGRFIKKVEVIDMGGLREYLIKSKVNIPGLRKIEDDVSIYIYKKHEEGYELVEIVEPDGMVKFGGMDGENLVFQELPKSKMQFAVQRVKEFLQKNSVVYTMRSHNLPDSLVNAEGTGRAMRKNLGKITPELMEKYVKQSGFDTVEEWDKAAKKFGKPEKMYLYKVTSKPLQKIIRARKYMAVIGSRKITPAMVTMAREATEKALESGWGIVTGGAIGIDAVAIDTTFKAGKSKSLVVYLAKEIKDQPTAVQGLLEKARKAGAEIVENEGFTRAARETGKDISKISFPQALFTRNKSIIDLADATVAIPDNIKTSRGTIHGIKETIKQKKPLSQIEGLTGKVTRHQKNKAGTYLKYAIKKYITKAGKYIPGLAALLTAADFWRALKQLQDKIEADKASSDEEEAWEYLKDVKEEMGEEIEEFDSEDDSYPGIYLVHPHSELIWSGTKTAIVKSKKFDKHMNVPLYLISDDKCYGVIELSTPVEIDKKEFGERYRDHLIEDFERIEWWGEKFPLYLYNVKVIDKFEPVRKVDIPAGIQVWLLPSSIKFVGE